LALSVKKKDINIDAFFYIIRVRLFSSSAQVCFWNKAVNLFERSCLWDGVSI